MTKECQSPDCENEIPLRGAWEAKRRKFCSIACNAAHQSRGRAERIEEIRWLVGTDYPESIARRVGYSTSENMFDVLRRVGEGDLLARLQAEQVRYMGPMVDDEAFV